MQKHYGLSLHKNFLLSTPCRPLLSRPVRSAMAEADASAILQRFRMSLRRCARAFLHLRSISCQAKRSWSFVHNGLTSVLLLSFMKETRNLDETKQMQSKLLESLMEEDEYVIAGQESGPLTQLSTTHQKAVRAIQALARLTKEENTRTTERTKAAVSSTLQVPDMAEEPLPSVLPETEILQTEFVLLPYCCGREAELTFGCVFLGLWIWTICCATLTLIATRLWKPSISSCRISPVLDRRRFYSEHSIMY